MVPLVVRECAVCLVALRDGRCDKATRHSITFRSHIYWGMCKRHRRSQCNRLPLSFERAQLLGRAPRRVL